MKTSRFSCMTRSQYHRHFAVFYESVFVKLVKGSCQGLGLVVIVGKAKPLIEGNCSISILINGSKLILTTVLPEFQTKLLWEGCSSIDHSLKFTLINFSIKILVGGDESPEKNVVKFDVAVIGGVFAGSLHEI